MHHAAHRKRAEREPDALRQRWWTRPAGVPRPEGSGLCPTRSGAHGDPAHSTGTSRTGRGVVDEQVAFPHERKMSTPSESPPLC